MGTATKAGEHRALRYLRNPLVVIAALGGGIVLGLVARAAAIDMAPVGQVYLLLLDMTLLPILVTATATGVAVLVQQKRAARILLRLAAVFLAFFVLAAAIAVAAGIIGHPGRGIGDEKARYLVELIRGTSPETDLAVSLSAPSGGRQRESLLDLATRMVPRNIFESLSAGSVLQVMIFVLVFGIAMGLLREKPRDLLVDLSRRATDAFKKINLWLIYALPLGAVALVSSHVASSDVRLLFAIGRFLLVVVIALAGGFLLLLGATWLRTARPLRTVLSAMVEPLTYAFITGESLISVPYVLRAAEERLGCPEETASAAVPVTMVIGRFGYLVYYVLAGIFIADFYGVALFPTDYLILVVGSAIAALATRGSAAAGSLAMVGLALGPLGLPAEPAATVFVAASLVVGPLVAIFETQASIAATVLVARREETRLQKGTAPRGISLRVSIVTLIASLIVLTGVVTVGLMYSAQRRNISHLADGMVGEVAARVTQRTLDYFSPAERTVNTLEHLVKNGLVDPANRRALIDIMRNQVLDNPEFASVYFGDTAGSFTMVKRMPDGSLSNRLVTRTRDAVHVTWEHANPEYREAFPSGTDSLEKGYDPRTRGWYRDALAIGGRIWTNVYLFASDNMLGISNAIPVRRGSGSSGAPLGVLAVDIGLAELSYFLGSLDVAEEGKAYILDEQNKLVALSMPRGSDLSALFSGRPTGSAASTANLVLADEAGDDLVRQSFLSSLRAGEKAGSWSFEAGGESLPVPHRRVPRGCAVPLEDRDRAARSPDLRVRERDQPGRAVRGDPDHRRRHRSRGQLLARHHPPPPQALPRDGPDP